MNPEQFNLHLENFKEVSPVLIEQAMEERRIKNKQILHSKQQRYWNNFITEIYAAGDVLHEKSGTPFEKSPVIIFGDGKFTAKKGSRSGNASWLKEYLSRFFLVLEIDEYHTSQKCSKCWGQLQKMKKFRVKKCTSCKMNSNGQEQDLVVNRDISAPLNMLYNCISLVMNGERLEEFRRNNRR